MALRVSGISLQVEGAEEFQTKLKLANSAVKKSAAARWWSSQRRFCWQSQR